MDYPKDDPDAEIPGPPARPADVAGRDLTAEGQKESDDDAKRRQQLAEAAAAKAAYDARFQYGGYAGGAGHDVNFYQSVAGGAGQRHGAQIDYSNANGSRLNQGYDRAEQVGLAGAMRDRALGNAPSISQMQADRQMGQAAAEQSSAAASARGPAALALAQQGAAANTANMQSNISNQAQINAAQERTQAQQAAMGAYSGIRAGDAQMQGMDAQQAQAQASLEQQQHGLNDAYFNANSDRAVDINKVQLQAQMQKNAQEVGQQQAAAALAQNQSQFDDSRTDKYIGMGVGAAGAVGAGVLTSFLGGGKADPMTGPSSSVMGPNSGGDAPYGMPGSTSGGYDATTGAPVAGTGGGYDPDLMSDIKSKKNVSSLSAAAAARDSAYAGQNNNQFYAKLAEDKRQFNANRQDKYIGAGIGALGSIASAATSSLSDATAKKKTFELNGSMSSDEKTKTAKKPTAAELAADDEKIRKFMADSPPPTAFRASEEEAKREADFDAKGRELVKRDQEAAERNRKLDYIGAHDAGVRQEADSISRVPLLGAYARRRADALANETEEQKIARAEAQMRDQQALLAKRKAVDDAASAALPGRVREWAAEQPVAAGWRPPLRQPLTFEREYPTGDGPSGPVAMSDGDAKGNVVLLGNPDGRERHWDADVSNAPAVASGGASLSGPSPKYSSGGGGGNESPKPKASGLAAAAASRKPTDAELERMGKEMLAAQQVQNDARLEAGAAVSPDGPPAWLQKEMEPQAQKADPMTDALASGLAPHSFEYKPEYAAAEGQQNGEKNVGIMAQNAEANPITGTIVERGDDGMRRINLKKAAGLSLAAAGHNAQKIREQQAQIDALKAMRGAS